MNIFVKMFEDKLVIESPGTFLPPTTAETVYEAHNPRNPHLMWGMYYFDFVKCAFEGTRRMRDGMLEAELPAPEFVQKQAGVFKVSVTLKNDVEHRKAFVHANVSDVVDEKAYIKLSDHEKMIINCLADRKNLTVTEACMVLDMDWRGAKAVLDSLEEMKIIERPPGKARDRNRRYFLRGRGPKRRS